MKSVSKKTLTFVATIATVAVATFAWTGCSDDNKTPPTTDTDAGHTTAFPACTDITHACHEVDVGEGDIHDCHETAHGAKSESECTAVKERCIQICEAAKADGGAGDHEDAGH